MKFIYEVFKGNLEGKKVVEVGCGKLSSLDIKKDKFFLMSYDSTYEGHDKKIVKRYLNSNIN